ncbi:MAG: hypothetical protein IJF63_05355 [Alistipes sp.]|nr:hypothetical protein [Alistipes sp.]
MPGQVTISGNLNVTYGTEVPDVTIDKHGSTGAANVYYYTNADCTAGETTAKPTNAGSYWVKVKMAADANYGAAESNVIGFTIAPKSISGTTVNLSATTKEYNGSTQSVTVSSVGTLNASDYDVSGDTSGTNVGDYTVTVTGKGNYTGTATATWKITPKTVTSAMIASVDSQSYTGSAITPKPAVTDGSALAENTDFTYSYEANTYVGTATVKITGKGNYAGTASKTFQISPVNQTPAITATANVTKGGNTLDLKTLVSDAQGTVSFEIYGNANGCSISNGILTSGADTGTVKITVNITAKDMNSDSTAEYNAYTGTEAITVTIVDKQSASLNVTQTGCMETLGGLIGEESVPAHLLKWGLDTLVLSVNYLHGALPSFEDDPTVPKWTEEEVIAADTLPIELIGTPKVMPTTKTFRINHNRISGEAPKWLLMHPALDWWVPFSLVFPQEGRAADGTKAGFTNAPASLVEYYKNWYPNKKLANSIEEEVPEEESGIIMR